MDILPVVIIILCTCCVDGQRASTAYQKIQCGDDSVTLMCPGEALHLISVHLGKTSPDLCPHLTTTDCTTPADASDIESLRGSCDGRMTCIVQVPDSTRSLPDGCASNGDSPFALIEYRCIAEKKNNKYEERVQAGHNFGMQLCNKNTTIQVDKVRFSLGTCPQLVPPYRYIERTVNRKCKAKRACIDLKGFDNISFHDTQDCSTPENPPIETVLYYSCIPDYSFEISRCVDQVFDEVLCEERGTGIHIMNAFYGDMGTKLSCSQSTISDNDCRANIEDTDPTYSAEITDKCEGKQHCEGLVAQRNSNRTQCNRPWNKFTEYVTLVYTCESEETFPVWSTSTISTTFGTRTTYHLPNIVSIPENHTRSTSPPSRTRNTTRGGILHVGDPLNLGEVTRTGESIDGEDEGNTFWTFKNICIVVSAVGLTVAVIISTVLGIKCHKWKKSEQHEDSERQENILGMTKNVDEPEQDQINLQEKQHLVSNNRTTNRTSNEPTEYFHIMDKDVFTESEVKEKIDTLKYGTKPQKGNASNEYSSGPPLPKRNDIGV